ncbi:DMT family transporter [Cytobacillus gottheilii]|uniref:DMT family transporter n=1 Tax=Cytobacillus gottheilii TaxID=859144 RepID=UPI0027D4502E|nr:DMT family transporter [Cytobacillus gottheilii]
MKNLPTFLMLTCVMAIWGFNVSIIKVLVGNFSPITITSLRILTAGITVFLILFLLKKLRSPSRKELIYILFAGLLNVVAHHAFLSIGLTETSATNGGLILGAGPLLTAIFSTVILKNRPTFIQVFGFLLGGTGVTFIVLSGGEGVSSLSMGDFYVFLSILAQALSFILISKASKTMDARLLTGYMLVWGAVILFVISLIVEPRGLAELTNAPGSVWLLFFVSAILATGVGHMVYNASISRVGPAEASIFLNLNTFFALAGSALFLGEVITVSHLLGLVLIVSGVLFGSGALEQILSKRKHKAQTM